MFTGRTIGAGLLRLDGEEPALVGGDWRSARERELSDTSSSCERRGDSRSRWTSGGPPRGATEVARMLKRKFDPAGILNAGRGPI